MTATGEPQITNDADDDLVLYRVEHRVAIVTLNRPERLNAWTPALGDRCFELLAAAANDPDIRVIVLTGAGRGFCAGADMALLSSVSEAPDGGPPSARYTPFDLIKIPKPIIAAVNGPAVGLGFLYALLCDIRFASSTAMFATGFVRIGLVAEHAVSWILQRMIGLPLALELLVSGRRLDANEAAGLHLVNAVHTGDELLEATLAYARDLAENCSPSSMAAIKRQVYEDADRSLSAARSDADLQTRKALSSADFKEGLAAFVEKRPPLFRGLPLDSLHQLDLLRSESP